MKELRTIVSPWALAAVGTIGLCACSGEEPSPLQDASAKASNAPTTAEDDPYAGSDSRFGTVDLYAGFSPDPRSVIGTAQGRVEASTIRKRCKGWITEKPDYVLDAKSAFFLLHVLVRSRRDTTLVVRKPSGAVLCNDNRKGTKNPMVRSSFPIGSTQIWIGVQNKGDTAPYRLGFSEVKWKSSSLPVL